MKQQSLYFYITAHLDKDGFYTPATLPDEPQPLLPQPLGAEDAGFYSSQMPPDVKGAHKLRQALALCLQSDSPAHRRFLYELCRQLSIAAVCDPLTEKLAQHSPSVKEQLLALAQAFFYQALHRGPMKLAILLCGVYGMERLKEHNPVLWRDLLDVARCEEFTFFFLYACRLGNFMPQHDVWVLLDCTKGWGLVYALKEARCSSMAQRWWLLHRGDRLEVDYPPLAAKIVQESHLADLLAQGSLSMESLRCAATALARLLLLLSEYPSSLLEGCLHPESLDLAAMLRNFLHQLCQAARSTLDYLPAASLAGQLRNLSQAQCWYLLTEVQVQELIAAYDAVLLRQDWEEALQNHLLLDGQVNYPLLDYALDLDYDLGPGLLALFQERPGEYQLLPYLLSNSEEVAAAALQVVEEHLASYMGSQEAFVDVLFYLKDRPGQGERLLCSALAAMYDWPRSLAVDILYNWGPAYLTPTLRQALSQARAFCYSPLLGRQIDELLALWQAEEPEAWKEESPGPRADS